MPISVSSARSRAHVRPSACRCSRRQAGSGSAGPPTEDPVIARAEVPERVDRLSRVVRVVPTFDVGLARSRRLRVLATSPTRLPRTRVPRTSSPSSRREAASQSRRRRRRSSLTDVDVDVTLDRRNAVIRDGVARCQSSRAGRESGLLETPPRAQPSSSGRSSQPASSCVLARGHGPIVPDYASSDPVSVSSLKNAGENGAGAT